MTATIILAVIAFASTLATVLIPLWKSRRRSPDSTALILTASATYFSELHSRLAALENRVEFLEAENRMYYHTYGALPKQSESR